MKKFAIIDQVLAFGADYGRGCRSELTTYGSLGSCRCVFVHSISPVIPVLFFLYTEHNLYSQVKYRGTILSSLK